MLIQEATERNIYRLILAAENALQLWLHKEEMCILNMSNLTVCLLVKMVHHGTIIVREEIKK